MIKTFSKLVGSAAIAALTVSSGFAQTDLGADCGCPPVGSRTSVNLSTLAVVGGANDGNLTATNTILTCDKVYVLDKKIFVPDGKTLTIRPGTLIKANTAAAQNATALVVSRGGSLNAAGTQSCPIVFTAAADPMDGSFGLDQQGLWGGVVVLGKATNNLLATNTLGIANGLGIIEGFATSDPRAYYGADLNGGESFDDNDNSGTLSYLSIRHGGATVGPDNELNGLTLGSVGKGTCIDHIEIVANSDDGIEFFGGTVDLKYGVVYGNDDDGFDWDQGWNGRGQFWCVVKVPGKGDNGFECDGDDNNSGAAPLSNPTIYNATCIGDGTDSGMELKELTNGSVYNSIFANYDIGVNFYDVSDGRATDAYDNWVNGTLVIESNSFIGNTTDYGVDGAAASAGDVTTLTNDGNAAAATLAGFDFTHAVTLATNTVTDEYDAVPNPAVAAVAAAPQDGFFSPVNYRGAFDGGAANWMKDWTFPGLIQATQGLITCPTDINNDNVTNVSDFLILLGQFDNTCQ